jgi:hypothetical protein
MFCIRLGKYIWSRQRRQRSGSETIDLVPASRDAFFLAVPNEVVEEALARPDRCNLNRGMHREYHLDRVERALAVAGHA